MYGSLTLTLLSATIADHNTYWNERVFNMFNPQDLQMFGLKLNKCE